MPKLFLIPVINVLDVHDAAVREWLSGLEDAALKEHLEYPFKLERFFPESARFALINGNKVHDEILSLFNNIDPQAVFLNISTDLYELENKYNKRLISPHEFWMEYYENISNDISEPARTLYRIYLNEIIDKNIRLIESKERLPLNVLFYGLNMRSRDELIPVYEEVFNLVEEFTLQIARAVNEIMNLREKPKRLWHSSFNATRVGISYEETEKFYDELLGRFKRLLKYKTRDYFLKSLLEHAKIYVESHEKFLDNKIREDEIKFSNITEGMKILGSQIERSESEIVILCEPVDYTAIFNCLKNNMDPALSGFSMQEISLTGLFEKMKPFIQKNRIMQCNYEIAMDILGREIPKRFTGPGAILVPK
ncbi:hypothetical protein METP3_01606 [Methanosarcinales archaeon]|nr:hypothetical protein METP3_01606 [Methanosarcinales archaeon]